MKHDYSVIVTTNRGIEALKPLFVNPCEDAELVIADANYNDATRNFLRDQSGYGSIVYVPIKQSPLHLKRNFAQGLNTALLYAEGDYIIRADDNLEFHPLFFERVEEDINRFRDSTNNRFAIIGRKLWASLGEKMWQDNPNFPDRYTPVTNPRFTFSFGIFPRELLLALNGYSEVYDVGWGYEDIEFLHRLMRLGYNVWFDKDLLAYSHAHRPNRYSLDFTDTIYNIHALEIAFGRVKAFNPFDYESDHIRFVAFKEPYIVYGADQFKIVKSDIDYVELKYAGILIKFNTFPKHEDLISAWLHNAGYYELGLLREIQREVEGGSFIDVGAYIGTHAVYFAKFCKSGKVYAFEPNPLNFELLKENVKLNDLEHTVEPHNIGMWSSSERKKYLKFGDAGNRATSRLDDEGEKEIEIDTIDNFFKGREDISCIKIDVVGDELEVLEGARHIIRKLRPLLAIEVQGTWITMPDWLEELGYKYKTVRSGNMNHVVLTCSPRFKGYKKIKGAIKFPI